MNTDNFLTRIFVLAATIWSVGCLFAADKKSSWDKGMDDDAGKAATSKTDLFTLPGASTEGQAKVYPIRDRLFTKSLNGTWNFALGEKKGFIEVPGNWETQGWKNPTYGNQIEELTGVYSREFTLNKREDQRYILRFDGVLFSFKVYVNEQEIGSFGSAYQLAQWDVTDAVVVGINKIRVEVSTRSRGWLFDTNDCWCLAGIQRDVEIYTVPKMAAIEDIVFRSPALDRVEVDVKASGDFAKVYIELADDDGRQVAGKEFANDHSSLFTFHSSLAEGARLWSPDTPYLYDLSVTLVDAQGAKIQRISQKVGIRTIEATGMDLLLNGKKLFLNGVAWNEIDPKEGRAISYRTRREQMARMKKAHVNCIRTAHYPFGPDFYDLADEMGFIIIDEVPFGSRGAMMLKNKQYESELLARTENTIRRDKNHPCVCLWTFGNENVWTDNTRVVVEYAKQLDPTRPRGLAQIGSSQFYNMIRHPERDVDFYSGHYLSPDRMRDAESVVTNRPMMQTEFAHSCGNGFCDFEDRYFRMRRNPAKWSGGCVWAWIDQCVMHPDSDLEEGLKMRNILKFEDGTDVPKDMRRDMPFELQGQYVDKDHLLDSWGDRGTDGVVYGDGTPKDAYWMMKRLYGEPDSFFTEDAAKARAEELAAAKAKVTPPPVSSLQPSTFNFQPSTFTLRIGRRWGMDTRIQSLRKQHATNQKPYLVEPEVTEDGKLRYFFPNPGKRKAYLEGTVAVSTNAEGKIVVDYDFAANDAAKEIPVLELGLVVTMPKEYTRVDWAGMGPLTAAPNRRFLSDFGTWSMHKDDYRFIGPRDEIVYALARRNGGGNAVVVESGTGKVSFENLEGNIVFTECMHVAGFGGKNGPSGHRPVKDIKLSGSFKLYRAEVDSSAPDVVPDLRYSSHYGF